MENYNFMENYKAETFRNKIFRRAYTIINILTVLSYLSCFVSGIILVAMEDTVLVFFGIGIIVVGIFFTMAFNTFATMIVNLCADVQTMRENTIQKTTTTSQNSDTIKDITITKKESE